MKVTYSLRSSILFYSLVSLLNWSAYAQQTPAQRAHGAQSHDMALLGMISLHGRSAYQPVIHRQGTRWIAYVGTHGGVEINSSNGEIEGNGTMILDVSDPRRPGFLFHLPGEPNNPTTPASAQMAQVCDFRGETYLLRSASRSRHEIWNVTKPESPQWVRTVVDGLTDIHKSWWECESGIAYIVGGDSSWRVPRMTKIYNLSRPEEPVFVRDYGLDGQQPGSASALIPPPVHGPIVLDDRVFLPYGTYANGTLQIADRGRLLEGDPEPTRRNLLYPQVSRIDMPSFWGGHTSFPLLGVPIADYAGDAEGQVRDFLILVSEVTDNECQGYRHAVFFVEMTQERKPFPVANFQVPASAGDFCNRGGRFGPHATNESFNPMYYRRVVFISYFNAGVRAVDVRNPYDPKEIAFYIPATTDETKENCIEVAGQQRCKIAVQTNNVEVDDRGYIYIVDRAGTGMHILELTGAARSVADLH